VPSGLSWCPYILYIKDGVGLVSELSLDELTVKASDVGNGLALGTYCLTRTGVGTVTEAQFIHLGNHSLGTACSLYFTLGKESKLAYL
jgi:hypothetical protein